MRYLKTKSQMDQFLVVEEPHPVTEMCVNKLHTCVVQDEEQSE